MCLHYSVFVLKAKVHCFYLFSSTHISLFLYWLKGFWILIFWLIDSLYLNTFSFVLTMLRGYWVAEICEIAFIFAIVSSFSCSARPPLHSFLLLSLPLPFCSLVVFETWSDSLAQAYLEIAILLPQPSECWNGRWAELCVNLVIICSMICLLFCNSRSHIPHWSVTCLSLHAW